MEGFLILEFIPGDQREDWINYVPTTKCDQDVLQDHLDYFGTDEYFTPGYPTTINAIGPEGFITSPPKDIYAMPTYRYPPLEGCGPGFTEFDVYSLPQFHPSFNASVTLRNEVVFTPVLEYAAGFKGDDLIHEFAHSKLPSAPDIKHPHSFPTYPIMSDLNDPNAQVMALLICNLAWDQGLRFLIPESVKGLIVVGRNTCIGKEEHEEFTYRVEGIDAFFMGHGNLHEAQFDDKKLSVDVDFHTHPNYTKIEGHCFYDFVSMRALPFCELTQFVVACVHQTIYPSSEFKAQYITYTPAIFSTVVAGMFLLMICTFGVYDFSVQGRYRNLIVNAAKTGELVSGMFPGALRDKVLNQTRASDNRTIDSKDEKSLAELYLDTTVLFADICGFTAWASGEYGV